MRRWPGLDPAAIRASNRKQAVVPAGATILEPVGTAPGLVVPPRPSANGGPTVVVLPGPPGELQEMWPAAAAADALRTAIGSATTYEQRTLRLYGIPESEIAETLRAAEDAHGLDGLEITTCLRRGELEVVTRFEPEAAATYAAFEDVVRGRHADTLFSLDGATVDEQVAELLRSRGWTIATAESCTGGLLAGRLTDLAGSSAYVVGGLVVYSNEAKTALAGVPADLIERVGAVSVEVAEALADGARAALGADVGVGITGVAGPGGGTATKPVGLVCFSVAGPDGARLTRTERLPGSRADVRERSTTVAVHLVRRLLRGEDDLRDG
jgi:nicotinamide-nucleotide amidase